MVNNCRNHYIAIVFELRNQDANGNDLGCNNSSANRREVHLIIRNWLHRMTRISILSTNI
jgi:hypothetical protein